jgi:cytochrome c-type biogenesis protein
MKSWKPVWYAIIAIAALVVLGFIGYSAGFLGTVYKVIMPERLGAFPLIVLSIIFGIAAFFSPCAFTVLPGYVAHVLAGGVKRRLAPRQVVWQSLGLGLIGGAGILLVNMVVGLVIAVLGAAAPFAKDPRQDIAIILAVRAVAGLVIAALGVVTLLGKGIRVAWIHRLMAEQGFTRNVFFYGVLYNGAAIGCTGPIMLGLLVYAFANASFAGAIAAFLAFAATMATLMVLLTLVTGIFKGAIIRHLAAATPAIRAVAGTITVIIGLAIALLTLERNRIFVRIFFPFLP